MIHLQHESFSVVLKFWMLLVLIFLNAHIAVLYIIDYGVFSLNKINATSGRVIRKFSELFIRSVLNGGGND